MITSGRRSTRLTRGSRLIPKKSFRKSSSSRLRNPRSLYPPVYPLVLDWFFHLQTCRKTSQCELDHHPRRHSSSKKRLEELEVRKLEMQLQLASLDRQVPSTNPTALASSAKSLGDLKAPQRTLYSLYILVVLYCISRNRITQIRWNVLPFYQRPNSDCHANVVGTRHDVVSYK